MFLGRLEGTLLVPPSAIWCIAFGILYGAFVCFAQSMRLYVHLVGGGALALVVLVVVAVLAGLACRVLLMAADAGAAGGSRAGGRRGGGFGGGRWWWWRVLLLQVLAEVGACGGAGDG
jgi:hypothetical protein